MRLRVVNLSIVALLTAGLAAAASRADQAMPVSRDGVWRQIFARPPAAPASALDAVRGARVALGARLFTDTRLSGDGSRSCASCHDPARAFTDGRPKAEAHDGSALKRNTPSLFNLAWSAVFFSDGRVATLEDQARVPMTATDEMAGDFEAIARRLASDSQLAAKFAAAFPGQPDISETNIVAALADYERTLVSPGTKFDSWVAGDDGALNDVEKAGFALFVGKAGCVGCHGGWRFTDDGFRDVGLPGDDPGRSAITRGPADLRQFKTPGLRELTRTAPYMHDGSLKTLRDVVDHYAGGFVKRPSLDSNLVRDLTLTDAEKAALVAFMESLSSAK